MKHIIDGEDYYLPSQMNDFQRDLYIHLSKWKRAHNVEETGYFKGQQYDLIFPDLVDDYFHIFPGIREQVQNLQFKKHKFFRHMASSQAACINLFVPMLQYPELAAQILRAIKPDLSRIAVGELDKGYQLEFWGKAYCDNPKGFLNDHNLASGTDADIAIAYYNHDDNLNLWLIEHKLSEAEFTICKAATSKGRTSKHRCEPANDVYENPDFCYYHSGTSYRYWENTKASANLFPPENLSKHHTCPFMGGMNQLWRNQVLARAIESSPRSPFKRVYFSVVHHPENQSLSESIERFMDLTNRTDRFFAFTSDTILASATKVHSPEIEEWINWYRNLYFF